VGGRPRRGALGLRGRIVGLVLFTTVATLAVAELALLGPLESSLKNAERKTLRTDLRGEAANFKRGLDLTYLLDYHPGEELYRTADPFAPQGHAEHDAALHREESLAQRIGAAEVTVLGYAAQDGSGHPLVWYGATDTVRADPFDDVAGTFRRWQANYSFGTINGTDYVRAALPFSSRGQAYVLAVRRPITEVSDAVAAVRNAFLTAALAGLALTLILGIPLSATLVRRLRRLRQAALRLAREGPGVRVPVDRARDEVGDLARTFATMQRQLQHQEEARRAFVATASHELRTPLASLDGILELLNDDLRGGQPDLDEARALLERARAQSRRLARLAGDLLDLSRIDAEVTLRSEPVELGELSRAVLAEFELGTAERDIGTMLEVAGEQVWALGDPGSIARILRILLDNAVRMSPAGAEVRVELVGGPSAELSVSDQGPGIAPEERGIIFERFQRGRDTAGQAGFGLGLAIGRELARRMRGELVLDASYGPGARFTLSLPVARPQEVRELTVG
jgi:signal transduction histidine kinase